MKSSKPNRGLNVHKWGQWVCVSGLTCMFAARVYELSRNNGGVIVFPEDILIVELMLHGY